MLYLVFAILFYVLFSVIFKICQRRGIDNLMVIFVNYVAAAAFQWTKMAVEVATTPQLTFADYAFDPKCLVLAFAQAFFFAVMFVVMDHSVWRSGMALSTAAAKVSLIIPVILSWMLLGQAAPYWGPVALILIAVVMIVSTTEIVKHEQTRTNKTDLQRRRRARALLVLVFVGYGISDFLLKIVQSATGAEKPTEALMGWVFIFSILVAIVCCLIGGSFKKDKFRKESLLWGLLLGAANVICTMSSVKALAVLPTNLYYPLNNIGVVAVAALVGAVVFREKLKKTQIGGLALALAAILWLFAKSSQI